MVGAGNSIGERRALPYTTDALQLVLSEVGIIVRWNTRGHRPEWSPIDDVRVDGWRAWDDHIEGEIRERAAKDFLGLKPDGSATPEWSPSNVWWKVMWDALMSRSKVDPFLVWARGLPVWDGVERVEGLLLGLLNLEDSELVRWASRFPFVGAIERAVSPGSKIDEMPVLIGPQGGGKSAWLANLLPVREWFGDHLTLDGTSREQAEALDGKVIVEVSEMSGSRRAEVERIKAFLTRTDDGQHRRAYARHTSPTPRMCVFIGTANDSGSGVLPRDPSGSRRFVSIPVGEASEAVEGVLNNLRDQLWSEAVARFELGNSGWTSARLPRKLIPDQRAANELFESRDQTLDERIEKLPREVMKMVDIADRIGILDGRQILGKPEQYRLADALHQAGWSNATRRIMGKQTKVWVPPGELRIVEDVVKRPVEGDHVEGF